MQSKKSYIRLFDPSKVLHLQPQSQKQCLKSNENIHQVPVSWYVLSASSTTTGSLESKKKKHTPLPNMKKHAHC